MFQSQSQERKSNGHSAPNLQEHETTEDAEGTYELREGPVARALERKTAQLPSDVFLWGATASILLSLGLQIAGRRDQANFVGHWAPTFLALGLYNKLVKVAGHDRTTG